MNEATATTVGSNALVLDSAEEKLGKQVSTVEMQAEAIAITDAVSYEAAADMLRNIKDVGKKVEEYWEPLRQSTYEAYQNVLTRKKEMVEPLKSAEKILKGKIGTFQLEQERIRREQEEAMRKAAQEEADRKLAEALEAQANGDVVGAEYAMAEAEVMDNVATAGRVQSQVPKAKGISTSKTWKITGIDSSKVPVEFNGMELRPVDEKLVLSLIKASKGKIQIPGVTYEETATISVRS